MQALAERSEGFTGADLAALVREAALAALTENLEATAVNQDHFSKAFQVGRACERHHCISCGFLVAQKRRSGICWHRQELAHHWFPQWLLKISQML